MSGSLEARRGRVILVGAGPGHPGLLTLRGADALHEADVVLYDDLASPELLSWVSPGAECINVGKRGHDAPTRSQQETEALLVERALAGDTVVRLKGGDPFVFGRGAEEASACRRAGIDFEVVPGVSAAVAAPAFAGIPLTDRRYAASFAVVTGHKDPTRVRESTRWAELGRAVDTLVILMGMRNLRELCERILAGGKPATTPAAAVMHGTLGEQRVVEAPLSQLADRVAKAGLGSPAAVVIGDVVKLREQISWWEQRPLFGVKVLVTRAAEQARELCGALRAEGAQPRLVPLLEYTAPDAAESAELRSALERIEEYDAVLFASTNAVRFFVDAAREARIDLLAADTRFGCVGPQTGRALLDAGLPVHWVGRARGGDADALLSELKAGIEPAGKRFLLPRSQLGRDVLIAGLGAAGAEVDAVTAYHTVRPSVSGEEVRDALLGAELDVLTFTSPSAVAHFVELLDAPSREAARRCIVAAIGATTAKALQDAGLSVEVIPERPDARSLVEALISRLTPDSGGAGAKERAS